LLDQAAISNRHEDGDPINDLAPSLNQGTIVQETVAEVVPPPPLPTSAASFPGGQQAWMNFLNKYLRTPDELEAGQKKSVMVRFSVGADGSISQFEIMQSGGEAFDNEVIRVLKKMPKWKPAVQNGHNVSVMFTQPVTFMAYEE
jgi:protein TonB